MNSNCWFMNDDTTLTRPFLIKTAWQAEAILENAPKAIPNIDEFGVATAADARDDA